MSALGRDALAADPPTNPVMAHVATMVNDWIVDSANGRVFATPIDGNGVVEYNASGQEVRRFEVGADPSELLLKSNKLIVACTKSPALFVVDLDANEVVGTVKVPGTGPYALFCSQVDNGLVYCVCNTGTAWWDGEVFQCDLKALQIRKSQKTQAWGQSKVVHVAMSPDGKWIVPDARGKSSPSGADLMKVDEDECTFTQVRNYHDSFGQIIAGPHNRYWTFGKVLYTQDITEKVRTFSGSPVAIHPQRDLAASKTDEGVVLERFSDATPVAEIPLNHDEKAAPANASRRPPSHQQSLFDPTVQFDLKHQLVFVGTATGGYWIDLKAYSDQLSPLLMMQVPTEVTTLLGQPVKVPLPVTNQAAAENARVVVADGPESATIADGELRWQPTEEDIGVTTFRLELRSADDSAALDAADMHVRVTLPKLDLGFHAKTMKLSPDGRFLAIWGLTPGEEDRHPAHVGSDDIAIVDLSTRRLLIQKTLPQGLRCAAIDSKHVYLAPASGNLCYRFTHTLTEGKRQFLQSVPKEMTKVSADRLAIEADQLQVLDTETMQPVSNAVINSHGRSNAVQLLGANIVQMENRIFDRETEKTLRIVGPVKLPVLAATPNNHNHFHSHRDDGQPGWGRRLSGTQLVNHQGSTIARWSGNRQYAIATQWPVAVLISTVPAGNQIQTVMELRNLVDGSIEHTALIDTSPARGYSVPNFYGARRTVLVRDRDVLFLNGTELFFSTIPQSVAKAMPVPAHFLEAQQIEIEVGKATTFSLAVAGDREGMTFSLLTEYPGLSLDSKDGEITVDTEPLWTQFIESNSSPNGRNSLSSRNQPSPLNRVENAKHYQQLTGKALPEGKIATYLPISAALRDSEGQEDRTAFNVIVVGDRDELEAARARREVEQERQRVEAAEKRAMAEKLRAAASPESTPVDMPEPASPNEKRLYQRLDELEKKIERLEALLHAVLPRLPEQE